jgi:SNF2 family DNA or RNA helicase
VVAVNAAVLLGKLLQCSAGVLYDNEGGQEILDFSERFNALIDIAESASTPVIVFVPFRGIQAVLMEKLSHHFGKGMVRVINGDTSLNERTEIVDLFQESKIKILLAHPKTTGHGIDLTASNVMVWYLPTFSNELYLQALDRIRRLSSVKRKHDKFLIYQFYSTNIEHNVYKALAAKGLTQSKVLELIRSK